MHVQEQLQKLITGKKKLTLVVSELFANLVSIIVRRSLRISLQYCVVLIISLSYNFIHE